MRILIDSGSYHALNVGDVAMLQAAVERLNDLWPDALISAVTNAPALLARFCPGVDSVPLSGRVAWLSDRFFGRVDRLFPRRVRSTLLHVEDAMRRRWPVALSAMIAGKRALAHRKDRAAPLSYVRALQRCDLVVATGAGVFTDAFAENALGVLTTIELAQQRNIPTVLTGQGLGPVASPVLRRRMADVLPRAHLIAVRERNESLRLLRELGVPDDRIVVTGDDALEMAYRRATRTLGDGIGVNVRIAGYAGTNARALDIIRPVVQRAAHGLTAPLVALPIAHHPDCHDGVAIREIIADGESEQDVTELPNPRAAIDQTSRCRVVVTGSYHAAVFALAQGIPVVGLAGSTYYAQKFAGLMELFPAGCTVVALEGPTAAPELESSIVRMWTDAPGLRSSLLRAAAAQVAQGRAAYRRLQSVVGVSDGSLAAERVCADT